MIVCDMDFVLRDEMRFKFYSRETHIMVDPVKFQQTTRMKAGIVADFGKTPVSEPLTPEDYEKLGRFMIDCFFNQLTNKLD